MINKDQTSGWIWTKDWNEEDKKTAKRVYFTKELELHEHADKYEISITADCRYKLYMNGEFVQYGPAKGDHKVHYFDTVDIGGYLHAGSNRIDVAVLHYPEDPGVGNHSFFSSDTPGLYLEGISLDGWKSRVDRTVFYGREEKRFAPLQIHEKVIGGAGEEDWEPVLLRSEDEMPEYLRRENLKARPIPAMFLKRHAFALPVSHVEANSEAEFVLNAGEEICAFVKLLMRGGSEAEIQLLYSECYDLESGKGDRTDSVNGRLYGYTDVYRIGENVGVEENSESETLVHRVFEPFWFRTFRFIKVTVKTGSEPLLLDGFEYLETGYPVEVSTQVQTSDESLASIWDISQRTLRRCMHETYVDCPYYEQLQYIMDTRSEILYTYAVSADDRLARKAIGEFARAQRPDGLLNCSYPNKNINVIPGFAAYYILMVHDHMMYFGDPELVKSVLPVIRNILGFYGRNVVRDGAWSGLVGKTGGENEKGELWSFIDWAHEWMKTTGMPPAGLYGPITMESLLYVLGLQKAAELEEYAGDAALAARDREEAARVQEAVRKLCMDENGFITDGPVAAAFGADESVADASAADVAGQTSEAQAACRMRSQHCQVFGILTGTLDEEEGRRNLETSMNEAGFARCSVAMNFYLFRALEQTGLYAYTDRCWDIWRKMVQNNCTTCVEAEFYARSECHAWGALALYEIPSVILGVRPAAPGYRKIEVKPCPGYLTSASGTVHTPAGDVRVSWHKSGEQIDLKVSQENSPLKRRAK